MSYKKTARQYFGAVNSYDANLVTKMVHPDYIQHNPFVPTGREAFVKFLPTLAEHNSRIENYRMLEDGSHIIMHHKWHNAKPFGANEMIAFHIIRFDSDGLIAEHWNVISENGTATPKGTINIEGTTELDESSSTARTKETAEIIAKSWINSKDHCEGIQYTSTKKVFADSNFALVISEGYVGETHSVFYDLLRIQNDQVAEKWHIIQEIPTENLANDNGMFGF